MAVSSYQFVMNAGPTPGKEFSLEKNEMFIGRDLTNDIVINDAEISRRHARLVAQAGGYVLEDLGSTNGTFVNGQRLASPYILRPGETVTLGEHVTLVYEQVQSDPDATIVAGAATSAPVMPPAPPPVAPPPPVRAAVPPPSFSGQVPQGPVIAVEPPAPPKKRGGASWIVIAIVIVLLLLCACAGIVYLIDANALWCRFLPFIPGCS
jgi:hypothetical protein